MPTKICASATSGPGVRASGLRYARNWLASQRLPIGDGTRFDFSDVDFAPESEQWVTWPAVLALLDAWSARAPEVPLRRAGARFAAWLLIRCPIASRNDPPPGWERLRELAVELCDSVALGLALRVRADEDRLDLHFTWEAPAGRQDETAACDFGPLAEWLGGALDVLAETCGAPGSAVAGSGTQRAMHLQVRRADGAKPSSTRGRGDAPDRWLTLGRLASGVAHDFNNLLTVVVGCTEELLDDLGADHPARDSAMQIAEAGERAGALTRQLLVFASRSAQANASIDVNDTLSKLGRLLPRVLAEGHSFEMSMGEDIPLVHGDVACLEQAIVHLVLNARDALPGGGRIALTTSAERAAAPAPDHAASEPSTAQRVRIEVEAEARPGSALVHWDALSGPGLELARASARECGGDVSASEPEGAPGQATRARLRLFLPGPGPGDQPPIADTPADATAAGGSEVVLVLDASPSVGALLARSLQSAGYRAHSADSWAAALALCDTPATAPALVVSDLALSDPEGGPAARTLAERCPGLRIVWMTGAGEAALERRGLAMPPPAPSLLARPFPRAHLLRAVRAALDADPVARPVPA